MNGRLHRWWQLPAGEKRQLLAYALLLPTIHLGLRWLGLQRTQAALKRFAPSRGTRCIDPGLLQWAERSAQLAAIAGRHGALHVTCLRQALAVETMLRRAGLEPILRLGVDRQGPSPDMHAWVELDGQPLGQARLRHQPFRERTPRDRR
jgi:hypothetical protein